MQKGCEELLAKVMLNGDWTSRLFNFFRRTEFNIKEVATNKDICCPQERDFLNCFSLPPQRILHISGDYLVYCRKF